MKLGTLSPSFRLGSTTPSRIYLGSNLVWTAAGADAYRAAVMADSPVAYWRLGESSGTVAADETGNAHSGTFINPSLGAAGPISPRTCATFNAASLRRVEVTDRSALDITGTLTMEAWIQSSGSYVANRGIIGKYVGSSDQRSFVCYLDGSGRIGFVISTSGTFATTRIISSSSIVGTGWRHVAVVYQPSTKMEIFIDGVSNASISTTIPSAIFAGNAPLWIGCQFSTDVVNHFDGKIAECAIYPTALSPARIAAHYAAAGY